MNQILLLPMADNETRRLLLFKDLYNKGQKNYMTVQKYEEHGGMYYHIALDLYGDWHKALKDFTEYKRKYGSNLNPYSEEEIEMYKKMLINDIFKVIGNKHYNRIHDISFKDYKNNGGKFDQEFVHKIYADKSKKLYKNQSQWKQALHDFYLEKERRNKLEWEKQFPLIKIIKIIENYYYTNQKQPSWEYLCKTIINFTERIKPYGTLNNIIKIYTRIPEYEKSIIFEQFKMTAYGIIEKYGYFSKKLYEKESVHNNIVKINSLFGSLSQLCEMIGITKEQRGFQASIATRHTKEKPRKYTNEDYKIYLTNIYNKYGFISVSLINNEPEPNRIPFNRFNKHFGSLANACAYFNIPYIAPAHTTKLYLEVKTKVLQILPTYFIEEKRFPWLKYKGLLQIDMYSPILKLAIEADGDQHYKKSSKYYETEQEWIDAITRDKIKNEELPKHGINLIRFNKKNLKQLPQILEQYKEKLELIQKNSIYHNNGEKGRNLPAEK